MLNKYSDKDFKEFNSKLIPNISKNKILGVKMGDIRKVAKDVKRLGLDNIFFKDLPHKYHEENLLHSILISNIADIDEVFILLNDFLPYVDNWAVCDSINPKIFKKYHNEVFERIKIWINSDHEYTVRFGIVCLLQFFLDENFDEEVNNLVIGINRDEYYINMATSWYFSYALISQYDKTIWIFENRVLDKWVHNKSISKAIESYRIDDDVKEYLRMLKVK